jgi:beta-glucosidase
MVDAMSVDECISQLQYNASAIDRLGIKEYNWWNEALHGVARAGMATVFPQPIGLAATFDCNLLRKIGDSIALEGRAKYQAYQEVGDRGIYKGLTFWSPNINIFRDPRWGRGQETYGEDPYLTSKLGVAFILGLQGEDPRYLKAAACAKHFFAHSGPESKRHSFNAVVSKKDMEETYLPAFKALVEAGVEGIMGAYNRVNGLHCCGSSSYLKELLRNQWGFEGYITSDCWAIADFHLHHHISESPEQSAALALQSGCDLNCGNMYSYLKKAYEKGMVDEEQIREAAKRVLATRCKLGMFDEQSPFNAVPYLSIDCKAHQVLNLRSAEQSLVLLRNKNKILPLSMKGPMTIAVIGPNANSINALEGNYHGTANRYYTVLEGLQTTCPEATILYSKGCHLYDNNLEEGNHLSEVILHVRNADYTVLVVGLDETLESEDKEDPTLPFSGDKKDLLLPEPQRKLIKTVMAEKKPTIIICLSGSPLDLEEGNQADAVIQAWYPGSLGGLAISRILLGKTNPSGRLPITFYYNSTILPDYEDYSMQNRTYRFFKGDPLYSFGFGLSYSTFTYQSLHLKSETLNLGEALQGSLEVYNAGPYDGIAVIEFYIRRETGESLALCGFEKAELAVSERRIIPFTIEATMMSVVDEQGERTYPTGNWTLFAGGCQPDGRSLQLLSDAATTSIASVHFSLL